METLLNIIRAIVALTITVSIAGAFIIVVLDMFKKPPTGGDSGGLPV